MEISARLPAGLAPNAPFPGLNPANGTCCKAEMANESGHERGHFPRASPGTFNGKDLARTQMGKIAEWPCLLWLSAVCSASFKNDAF
jgi:hypothetical protein